MSNEDIIAAIQAAIELDDIKVLTDDGSHFQIIAVSDIYADLSRVKKQQTIYGPLSAFIADNRIHALSVKTYTNAQWQRERKLQGF
ncbi:BolA family protein [Utexia brackfieldae]|uniref:BolA family protein n=1 Tax=Utexia brackfieldae TaxID=3074108 RepID=UPI00370DB6EE